MARRIDSGWRDEAVSRWHGERNYAFPLPGAPFPMVEYDRGRPLAVLSYQRRGERLPTGPDVVASYDALGGLYGADSRALPFITVQYDPRNWAYRLLAHNKAGRNFLVSDTWVPLTEAQFLTVLYALRGRPTPDLEPYGVRVHTSGWIPTEPSPDLVWDESWPHQIVSHRRRCFEPVGQVRATWRNPCVDIDFAVVDDDSKLALIVDYKAPGAKVNLATTNMAALSGLRIEYGGTLMDVPTMVVRYEPADVGWDFQVHCLNVAASRNLSYVLGAMDAMDQLAQVVAGEEWVRLNERQWAGVLGAARSL